jgi:hypothetical protein
VANNPARVSRLPASSSSASRFFIQLLEYLERILGAIYEGISKNLAQLMTALRAFVYLFVRLVGQYVHAVIEGSPALAAIQCSASEFCLFWHTGTFFSGLQLVILESNLL